jgi:hypothetical protein
MMQYKEGARQFGNTITLAFAALVLSGCLEKTSGEGGSFSQPGSATTTPGTTTPGTTDPAPTNSAPTISGSPATAVIVGDMYSFTPTASDANGDTLTFSVANLPSWASFNSATGKLSGQPTLAAVGTYDDISISVSDGTKSASLRSFTISVNQTGTVSTTLSWTAPTQNEDGTALTDLAGYTIYWGRTPGVYTNSVTIDNPGVTTYVVENLTPGTYEFVATAFNQSGIESNYSNPATKVLN